MKAIFCASHAGDAIEVEMQRMASRMRLYTLCRLDIGNYTCGFIFFSILDLLEGVSPAFC